MKTICRIFCAGLLLLAHSVLAGPSTTVIPVLTVRATTPVASEVGGDPGVFTIYRSGDTNFSILVLCALSGTATNGVDYETLPGAVVIPAGVTSTNITVKPINDGHTDGTETVILSLRVPPTASPVGYQIGVPGTAVVTIIETELPPPVVNIVSPLDGTVYAAPARIPIYAAASEVDKHIKTVEFFANDTSLGIVTNSVSPNPLVLSTVPISIAAPVFSLVWSNASAGDYALTAKATDDDGVSTTSKAVNIEVVSGSLPPVVTIYASDPIASEGTNLAVPPGVGIVANVTNTATFVVRRKGDTNTDLPVFYSVSGTASNGVDYAELPGVVTIPAGKYSAKIVVRPLDDNLPEPVETVILSLLVPVDVTPLSYSIGYPNKAEAIILDNDYRVPPPGPVAGLNFHFSQTATNGLNYCLQFSTDLTNWTSLYTNSVTESVIDFVDPDALNATYRYYRAIEVPGQPPE